MTKINWLKIESLIRMELRNAVRYDDPENRCKDARTALHRIDLILGDETGRGYEIEGVAPAEWLDRS